jgi:hypothetical protein
MIGISEEQFPEVSKVVPMIRKASSYMAITT